MAVVKVIELLAESEESWEDAARQAARGVGVLGLAATALA
jgi:flavin-binding protein dodecin